jgi:SpoVK/Ycf46/Vps4 family AAA+-type ATPase
MMGGKSSEDKDKLDLATLLNVLDGVRETPGRIIILSTNYPERLDEALLRPGRFDMMLEFEKHSPEVMRQHLEKHYDTVLTEKQWVRINRPSLDKKWTPAEVSQILFRCLGNMDAAIDDLVNEDPAKIFKFSQMGSHTGSENQMRQEAHQSTDLSSLLEIAQFTSENILVPLSDTTDRFRESNEIAIQELQRSPEPLTEEDKPEVVEEKTLPLLAKLKIDNTDDSGNASDYSGCDSPEPGWSCPRRRLTPEEKEERKRKRKERDDWFIRTAKEQKENTIETVLASSMFKNFLEMNTNSETITDTIIAERDTSIIKLGSSNPSPNDIQNQKIQAALVEVLASPMFHDMEGLNAANDDSICDASCLDEYYEDLDSQISKSVS